MNDNYPEYEEGRAAFREGEDLLQDNPYTGSPLGQDYLWECGWKDERNGTREVSREC